MANADRKVQHNYRDHANVTDNMSGLAVSNELAHSASDRNFPVKLYFMLNELESDGLSHIVSWQPHGRCFVVHKQEDFVKTILPMYVSGRRMPQCEPCFLLAFVRSRHPFSTSGGSAKASSLPFNGNLISMASSA
jgi:HSF-type DNA-binding